MGMWAEAATSLLPSRTGVRNAASAAPSFVATSQQGQVQLPANTYDSFSRWGYKTNSLVYACIELLATSAAEPRLIGRKYAAGKKGAAKARARWLDATGMPKSMIGAALAAKNLAQDVPETPAAQLANKPNPFASRFQLWSTLIMDLNIAGNAYLWKSAKNHTPRNGRPPQELWRLRPDRVSVIPDPDRFISGYQYRIGGQVITLAPEDVIHFKTRDPLNDYYGQSPLLSIASRIDLDNVMVDFPKEFFRNAAVPAGVLVTKGSLSQDSKDEIRDRWGQRYSGAGNWHGLVVLDNTEATFTPTTMALGTRGLVLPDLNAIGEARITAAFGIPASIAGALIGLEKSSYANNKIDWNILWQVKLMPLYSDLDDQLTLSLLPDFGYTVDELIFDMADVKALQEDIDALMDRARKNVDAGLWTLEEARVLTGVDAHPNDGEHILLPIRSTLVPTPLEDLQPEAPPPLAVPDPTAIAPPPAKPVYQQPAAPAARAMLAIQEIIRAAMPEPEPVLAIAAPRTGRPRLGQDAGARSIWESGTQLRADNPRWTETQIADRLGVAASTWRRYRAEFDDDDD